MSVTKTINSISIAQKIGGAFLAIVLVISGLAAISMSRVASTNEAVRDMVQTQIGALAYLDEMRNDVAQYRARLNRGVWLGEDKANANIAAWDADVNLAALVTVYSDSETRYATKVGDATEAAVFEKIKLASKELFSLGGATRALLVAGKIDEAKVQLVKKVFPAADALDRVLLQDYKLNSDSAVADADIVAQDIKAALLNWMVVLIAALIFVAAAGVFLTASIAMPIKTLIAAMSRLAGGDVNMPIPERDREDEFGQMAHVIDTFRQKLIGSDRRAG